MPFKKSLIGVQIVFKNYYVVMIRFKTYIVDVLHQKSDEWYSLKGAWYGWKRLQTIRNKDFKLKNTRNWFNKTHLGW